MAKDKAAKAAEALERAAELMVRYGDRWERVSRARAALRQYVSVTGLKPEQALNEVKDEAARLKDSKRRISAKR